jgi:hypothetical protein
MNEVIDRYVPVWQQEVASEQRTKSNYVPIHARNIASSRINLVILEKKTRMCSFELEIENKII